MPSLDGLDFFKRNLTVFDEEDPLGFVLVGLNIQVLLKEVLGGPHEVEDGLVSILYLFPHDDHFALGCTVICVVLDEVVESTLCRALHDSPLVRFLAKLLNEIQLLGRLENC